MLNVLQQDLSFILCLLDKAITHANCSDEDLYILVTVCRFGQKEETPVVLDFINMKHLTSMSIHVACNITAKDPCGPDMGSKTL